MAFCFIAGAAAKQLAVSALTLSWIHSIEKTELQEDWRISRGGITVTEIRAKGTGAGIEIPQGARLEGGWFRWKPGLAPQREIILARSGATADWRICVMGKCRGLSEIAGPGEEPVKISACK